MAGKLTFFLSKRSKVFDGATPTGGRLTGSLQLLLHDELRNEHQPLPVTGFQFPGPGDIGGFRAGVVRKMCPEPGAEDAETTKLVHVDLADPELPWRYTPNVSAPTRPWMVLVVGKASAFKNPQGIVTQPPAEILKEHPLADSARWAHVQSGDGPDISRLVSPVRLGPFQRYVAAIVPAFRSNGDDQWDANGVAPQAFALFHYWEFSTGAAGDFESLVQLLRVRKTEKVGTIELKYRSTNTKFELRGAITTLAKDPTQEAELNAVRSNLDLLNNPVRELPDDGGPARDIIGLPQYGRPWVEDPNSVVIPPNAPPFPWPRHINEDPRYRSIAGMGTWLGIEAQEELMAAAVEQSGALQDVAHRIRQLALGVDLSSRLWSRRLPDNAAQRLEVFGPAMGRLAAKSGGTVLARVTGIDPKSGKQFTLAASQFSSAAMRMLRNGTARTRHLQLPGKIDRGSLLEKASQPPAKPDKAPDGSHQAPAGFPHADLTIDPAIGGAPVKEQVVQVIAQFSGSRLDGGLIEAISAKLNDAGYPNVECVQTKLAQLINDGVRGVTRELLMQIIRGCVHPAAGNRDTSIEVLVASTPPEPPDRFQPVPIGALSNAVSSAIDPTKEKSPSRVRVQDTIGNFPIGNMSPPELPLGLDFPTWQLVNRYARDWLLPGAGTIPEHSIVSLQTNPTFIDAFLVGINAQFLAEARWRNLWIERRFTPLRMFWGHIDPATGKRTADIQPLAEWAKPAELAKDLGDKSHQTITPRDATGKNDLIILFRSELFRRYPGTLVYLIKPPAGIPVADLDTLLKAEPNFSPPTDGTAQRVFGPIFMGSLTPDLVFFAFDVDPSKLDEYWLVLDEPPAELRFRNLPYTTPGRTFDKTSIDQHTRVAIAGDYLEKMGGGS